MRSDADGEQRIPESLDVPTEASGLWREVQGELISPAAGDAQCVDAEVALADAGRTVHAGRGGVLRLFLLQLGARVGATACSAVALGSGGQET